MHSMRVSKFHRLVSAALSASLLAVTCQTTMAQEPRPVERSIQWRLSGPGSNGDGQREGELLAQQVGTGGKLRLGVGLGILFPFLAPAIAYFLTGPAPMTAETVRQNSPKSLDYQMGFESGWEKTTKSKKRKPLLIGGLVGSTAILVLVALTGFGVFPGCGSATC